jgi:hypothetical protein
VAAPLFAFADLMRAQPRPNLRAPAQANRERFRRVAAINDFGKSYSLKGVAGLRMAFDDPRTNRRLVTR